MSPASFGKRSRSASATCLHCWCAASAVSWTKMVTPRRPRSARERRKLFQNGSAPDAPGGTPSTARRPSVLTATAIITGRDDPPGLAHLQVGGVDPQVGPLALDRAAEEGVHPLVDLDDPAADLALRDARGAHRPFDKLRTGLTRSSTARVETPWTQASWITAVNA